MMTAASSAPEAGSTSAAPVAFGSGRPQVSVVMTVYNDLRFLVEAVDSILGQEFDDLELVIVDDGTGQDALFRALERRDRRIRLVVNPTNLGTAAAANRGIEAARADIIVRLDADDVAEPTRVGCLVAALADDPLLGLVGSAVTLIDEAGHAHGVQRMPETDLEIRWTLLFHNPFYHSTVAFRRNCFEAAGRYRIEELVSQDHYLWFCMLPLCRARNLAEPLTRYRLNPQGLIATHAQKNPRNRTLPIRAILWARLGLTYNLHDDALALDVSQFLRGFDIAAPERRAAAYGAILTVLRTFLAARHPFARPDDAEVARRLARTIVGRVLAHPPARLRERLMIFRLCWPLDRHAAINATMRRLAGGCTARWRAAWQRLLRPRADRGGGEAEHARKADEPIVDTDFSNWFVGKTLSTDWTSRFFPLWASLLAPRRDEALEVLEIGSWEGRSAIFFLQYLRQSRITCIDTFSGSVEHALRPQWASQLPHIEERFDANLAEFGGRVEKIKATSSRGLASLLAEGRQFDIAYIDGNHHSADSQADAMYSWPMIRDDGIVIFDDYEWTFFPNEIDRPKFGIDTFLSIHPGQYRELHRGYQLIIQKLGPNQQRPDQQAPGQHKS